MSNEELLDAFAGYLDAVLGNAGSIAVSIKEKTVTESDARLIGYVERAARFLRSWPSIPDAPLPRPMNAEQTRQEALAVVESYAASHTLQGMTREDYCSLERSFERDALEIFFEFLQILQATKVKR